MSNQFSRAMATRNAVRAARNLVETEHRWWECPCDQCRDDRAVFLDHTDIDDQEDM